MQSLSTVRTVQFVQYSWYSTVQFVQYEKYELYCTILVLYEGSPVGQNRENYDPYD